MEDFQTSQHAAAADPIRAVRLHATDRRRSLAGVPDLFRTHKIHGAAAMAVASIDTGAIFPSRSGPITFRSAIRITGAAPKGLVFEFGSSARGCGLGITGAFLALAAGSSTSGENALALFNNGATLPVGLELDLVAAISPGDGRVRVWGNGTELARATASGGDFNGDWAADSTGSFAAAADGTPPPGLGALNFAPTDFEVIEPLSVYVGQTPRHFV